MTLTRQFAVFPVALLMLLSTACEKKKTQLPPKTLAPTLAVSVPSEIPETDLPPEPSAPQEEASVQEPPPKKSPPKHHSSKKPAPPPPANQPASANQPPSANQATQVSTQPANSTVAVNHPPANSAVEGAPDTAIAADVSSQQLVRQKQTTADLLDSTEKDVKGLNHGLSHDEEAMLTQIKSYVTQSRKASSDGDFERAYNLAMKAHLLADALLKK